VVSAVTALTPPQHPLVWRALNLAHAFYRGRRPAVGREPLTAHTMRFLRHLERHVDAPAPELVAAALLHHALDGPGSREAALRAVARGCGWQVARVVEAFQDQADRVGRPAPPGPPTTLTELWASWLVACEHHVVLTALLHLAPPEELVATADWYLPAVRRFLEGSRDHLLTLLAVELAVAIDAVDHAAEWEARNVRG
jgi:hypothetical protein